MRRLVHVLTAAAAFGAVAAPRLFAGEEPSAPVAPSASPDEQAAIARRIDELGSPDFRVREGATKALIEFGAKARPALTKALESDNPAVRFRADQLLHDDRHPGVARARVRKPVPKRRGARPVVPRSSVRWRRPVATWSGRSARCASSGAAVASTTR